MVAPMWLCVAPVCVCVGSGGPLLWCCVVCVVVVVVVVVRDDIYIYIYIYIKTPPTHHHHHQTTPLSVFFFFFRPRVTRTKKEKERETYTLKRFLAQPIVCCTLCTYTKAPPKKKQNKTNTHTHTHTRTRGARAAYVCFAVLVWFWVSPLVAGRPAAWQTFHKKKKKKQQKLLFFFFFFFCIKKRKNGTQADVLLEVFVFLNVPRAQHAFKDLMIHVIPAIHTTYRISLRSSSSREPRYPLLGVVLLLLLLVFVFFFFFLKITNVCVFLCV